MNIAICAKVRGTVIGSTYQLVILIKLENSKFQKRRLPINVLTS